MIDFDRGIEVPAGTALEGLLGWTEGARGELQLDQHLEPLEQLIESGNGAQRQWRRHEAGDDIRQIYADIVGETCITYAEAPVGAGICGGFGSE